MRRLSLISLILLLGAAAAPQRALAQAVTPPAQTPPRSRPPLSRPPLRKRPSPRAACSR